MATGQVAFLSAHLPASILRVLPLIPICDWPHPHGTAMPVRTAV